MKQAHETGERRRSVLIALRIPAKTRLDLNALVAARPGSTLSDIVRTGIYQQLAEVGNIARINREATS